MRKTLLQCAAALLSASFVVSLWEPFRQSGNVWFALVPLILLARHVSPWRAFWLGGLMGLASWVGQLWWMLRLTDNGGPWPLVIPALLGLSATLALFTAAFAGTASALRRALPDRAWARILLALLGEPILWAGFECLRSTVLTGFAWNPLGLVCTDFLPLAQVAALGGASLASALLIAANSAIATLAERVWGALTHTGPADFLGRLLRSVEAILPLGAVLLAFVWGIDRIRAYDALPKPDTATLALQRTEVPCRFLDADAPDPWADAEARAGLLPYVKADLWLWPESAAAGVAPARLAALAREAKTPLLVGGLWREGEGFLNAAILVTEHGPDDRQVYGKRHLVPFGEYIPFDKTFPWLQRFAPTGVSITPGDRAKGTLRLPSGLTVGPLICFEDTVARMARDSVRQGARLLLNLSNDAWYAPSAQGAQHARQAILRCVETGVPMARSTNGGLNTLIDPVGRVVPFPQEPGLSTLRVPLPERPYASLYLRYGDLTFGGPCAFLALAFLLWLFFPRARPRVPAALPLLLLLCLLPAAARAQAELLPAAGMALDDGNLSLAERTARSVLDALGLSPAERARAQEILIRADLARGEWASALARIEATPELPAERRLALTLAAHNGRRDFAKTQLAYAEAKPPADTPWGVAALRLALRADLELGKDVQAAERFAAVEAAPGADARVRAENALEWAGRFPNAQSRAALRRAAAQADRGGVFLDCALALPQAYASAPDRAEAQALLDRLLGQEGLAPTVEARLALAAAVKGYRLILTMPETMSVERRKLLAAYGAELVLTPGAEGMAGAIAKAEALRAANPGSLIPQQFENPANPAAHERATGPEILRDLGGAPDVFVAGVGTGGTLTGVGRALRKANPKVTLVAVEPEASAVLSGRPAGPHKLQGIGAGFVPKTLDRALIDRVVAVSAEEAGAAAREAARTEGVLCGISGGAALHAARLVAQEEACAGKRVVVLLPDGGDRYLSTWLWE